MEQKHYDIIRRPVLTEKSTLVSEMENKYSFEVPVTANKFQIKDAVQTLFDVKVEKVRTMIVPGKWKKFARGTKKRPNWKKAIVKLADGNKIEFFKGK